jgi:hypothetical protein
MRRGERKMDLGMQNDAKKPFYLECAASRQRYSIVTPITRESSIILLKLCSIAKNAVINVLITFKLV